MTGAHHDQARDDRGNLLGETTHADGTVESVDALNTWADAFETADTSRPLAPPTDPTTATTGRVARRARHAAIRAELAAEETAATSNGEPRGGSATASVLSTGDARDSLHQITRRFDAGDSEPVYFGSHRRAQAVIVPVAVWEKLLARTENDLDLDTAAARAATGAGSRLPARPT